MQAVATNLTTWPRPSTLAPRQFTNQRNCLLDVKKAEKLSKINVCIDGGNAFALLTWANIKKHTTRLTQVATLKFSAEVGDIRVLIRFCQFLRKHCTELKQLRLHIEPYKLLNHRFFHALATAIKAMKSLESVSVSVDAENRLFARDIQLLTKPLQRLTQLHQIKLNFAYCETLNNAFFNQLHLLVHLLPPMNKIELGFNSSNFIATQDMRLLSRALAQHACLQTLSLDFSNTLFTDESFYALVKCLEYTPNLHTLNLKFNADNVCCINNNIDNNCVNFLLALLPLDSLRCFRLELAGVLIDNEVIESLFHKIIVSKCSSVRLVFSDCDISPKQFNGLATLLSDKLSRRAVVLTKRIDSQYDSYICEITTQ